MEGNCNGNWNGNWNGNYKLEMVVKHVNLRDGIDANHAVHMWF